MTATELIHLTYDGNFQLETDAKVMLCKVISSSEEEEEPTTLPSSSDAVDDTRRILRIELQVDKTSMHPQGGGQPTDIGCIKSSNNSDESDGAHCYTANIDKVTIDRDSGVVTHSGSIALSSSSDNRAAATAVDEIFPRNSPVKVSVNPTNRQLLSECHTAGHVVDAAMARCQKLFPPTKGYHFLDGPYVEYKGSIDIPHRDEFLSQLQTAYQQLIDEDIDTQIKTLPVDEAEELCNRLAQNFNMNDFTSSPSDDNPKVVRVVTVAGWNCPCGGTHVKSTGVLKERGWCVKGLRCKKGVVRVRYGPKDEE
jgi:Ser-tRNA(Ala) deacylase AlaX